jgi:hypothetical protein
MKNLLSILTVLLFTFGFWTCVSPETKEDLSPCPSGKPFFVDAALLNYLTPINPKAMAIFKDSLSNEIAFVQVSSDNSKGELFEYECPAHCNGGKCSNLVLTPDKMLRSVKDSTLSLYLFTQMDREEAFKNTICGVESIGISLFQGKRKKELMLASLFDGCGTKDVQKTATYSIGGLTFTEVLADKSSVVPNAYLDKKVGIRAFRDFDNKLWVFDRYE